MLRRGNTLVGRARERIRTAAEHDPHAWPQRDDDRAILVHDDEGPETDDGSANHSTPEDGTPDDTTTADTGTADTGAGRPPLGSPAPGGPDLDRVGTVSGP